MSGTQTASDREAYVRAVIAAYVRLPATPIRPRRGDRSLAAALHLRGITLETVEAAFILATTRRIRPTDASQLPAIRSLHYFLPVIEEILRDPPPASYVDYLRGVVAERTEQETSAHERTDKSGPAPVQKTTFLHER